MDPCIECGFVDDELPVIRIPDALRSLGPRYRARLEPAADRAALRTRPAPDVWSALEYACHARDVLGVFEDRVGRVLSEDCPSFEPMGRDERVERERYNDQDPAVVGNQLGASADALAGILEALPADAWARECHADGPEPAVRTLAWVGRCAVHEGEHHLVDLDRSLDAATNAAGRWERPTDRFRRTGTGAVVAAGMLGLRDALEGRPEREETMMESAAREPGHAGTVDVVLDPDHPERSYVVIHRDPDDGAAP